jgi:sarcosine oxidase subunit alpha
MMTKRITNHPLLEDVETETVEIYFNNKPLECNINDSVASCLLANGIRTVRHHEQDGSPRGIFCNIGHCFECRADINGKKGVRTCLTQVKDGMTVTSGQQLPHDVKEWSERHV